MLRVLFVYILYSSANDNSIYFYFFERPDLRRFYHFLTSVFTIIEFSIFAWILKAYVHGHIRLLLIKIISIAFIGYCIVNYFESLTTLSFDSMPASIEAILLIIFCIFFFFEQLTTPPTAVIIYRSNSFWVVIGIMVYTSLGFFLFLQSSITSMVIIDSYWDINLISNILKNIIFAIAFVITGEKDDFGPKQGILPSYKI